MFSRSPFVLLTLLYFTHPMAHATETLSAPLIEWDRNPPQGSLVIIGGSLRSDDAAIWGEIVSLAKTHLNPSKQFERPRIIVFATASNTPDEIGTRSALALTHFGADAWLAPLVAPGEKPLATIPAMGLAEIADQVLNAQGVFFTGGDQKRIFAALRTKEGVPNQVFEAIIKMYRQGGVIAGNSAGAAIMSRVAYRDAEFVLPTLTHGVTIGKEIDYGLGVMRPDWFIDQHCLSRGRFARALVAMQKHGFKYGLGIDDSTALVVRSTEARIIGESGVIFLDAAVAVEDRKDARFNWKNIKMTYLDHGDHLDLSSLAVTLSAAKLKGERLDPLAPGFEPAYDVPLFSNDVLGKFTLTDMMRRLMHTKDNEGIGLAFDGHAARQRSTPGFEFRMYRGANTQSWSTDAAGNWGTTVLNVFLDVRPIVVKAPLYQ